eukprot:TRINITY_DN3559_c0_g1_i1.p2 TRINITY_DN3559_c0_g1~~TRINITY_DN3559_c0_g1_i1.p2  ORF type:complete len:199 (-),score=-15.08 TRINITY_DN3559_c0_g1_i1:2-598(-)
MMCSFQFLYSHNLQQSSQIDFSKKYIQLSNFWGIKQFIIIDNMRDLCIYNYRQLGRFMHLRIYSQKPTLSQIDQISFHLLKSKIYWEKQANQFQKLRTFQTKKSSTDFLGVRFQKSVKEDTFGYLNFLNKIQISLVSIQITMQPKLQKLNQNSFKIFLILYFYVVNTFLIIKQLSTSVQIYIYIFLYIYNSKDYIIIV